MRQAFAVALVIASTAVPAGTPEHGTATLRLQRERALAIRTAVVVEEARVSHIAKRYRKPPEQVRRVVRATEKAADRHGLPPALLLAIVETESSFNESARSGYGARGLMQIVPRHHPDAVAAVGGAHRLFEPEANVEAGAMILSTYVERNGSLPKALTRYSGGSSKYASKVLKRQQELERIANSATREVGSVQQVSSVGAGAPRG